MSEIPCGTELRQILRDFPKEHVEKFLAHLFIIWELTPQMQRAASSKERQGRLRRIAAETAAFTELLERNSRLDAESEEPPTVGAFLARAEEAGGLRELIGLLEAHYIDGGAVDDPEMTTIIRCGELEEIAALLCARERREERLIGVMTGPAPALDYAERQQIAAAMKDRRPIIPHIETLRLAAIRAVRALREAVDTELARTRPARTGRKSADELGMLAETARTWARTFSKLPTTTREGPFYAIAVALTGKAAPDRSVKHAVQTVRDEAKRPAREPRDARVYLSAAQLTGQAELDRAIDRAKEKQRN